ncbi:hypothetical protein D3C87_1173030 [compost metagenome]
MLDLSSKFQVAKLGTPQRIAAGMKQMDREVTIRIEESYRELGEIDQDVVGRVNAFIDQGRLPQEPVDLKLFDRVRELDAADPAKTRESRMQTMLQAGKEWLEAAKGPGLNLLNVAGRTGLIVAMTTVLRQVVSYHVEQALREGDSSEASRVWAVVATTMIGPALTLMGAIRNERDGTASPASRLGRVCMASITMGALIAAHLTGAASTLLPTAIGGSIYTLARGLANAVIPLQDNAEPTNVKAAGATTAAYGAAQFLLAELGQLAPLSGPARAATGLGYSLGADAIQGAVNGFAMALDDVISILCKSWHVLSPSPGLDSVFSDPESLQQRVLQVRAGVLRPNRTQLADALFNIGALRLSAGHAIALVVGAVAALLNDSEVDAGYEGHILNGCLALMAMIIYLPLVFGITKRTDNLYVLQETAGP